MYPYRVDGGQRFHFVVKVKELVSVHKYPEPLVLAVDLDLQEGQTDRGREGGKEEEGGEHMRPQSGSKLTVDTPSRHERSGVVKI